MLFTKNTNDTLAKERLSKVRNGGGLLFRSFDTSFSKIDKSDVRIPLDSAGESESEVWSSTITTGDIDEYDSVVHPDGVDFSRFIDNPIVYRDHGWLIDELPIGRALSITPMEDRIDSLFVLAEGVEPADSVRKLLNQMIYRAISIGFNVTESEWRSVEVSTAGGEVFAKDILHILKWTLWEYSVVGIPANQHAQVHASVKSYCSDVAAARALSRRMLDLMQKTQDREQVMSELKAMAPDLFGYGPDEISEAMASEQCLRNMLAVVDTIEDQAFRDDFADIAEVCYSDAFNCPGSLGTRRNQKDRLCE